MIALPISGRQAWWRPTQGSDDLVLAEHQPGLEAAVAIAGRCVLTEGDAPLDVSELPVGDVDVLIVQRRRELLGDGFVAEGSCSHCAAPIDIHFSLRQYVQHRAPRASRAVERGADSPWWTLRGRPVSFRVPTAADVLAAQRRADGRALLLARCVRGDTDARLRRAVLRAMDVVGPTLRSEVAGRCPECAADVLLAVDARELCLNELRFLAGSVVDEVHLIAATYHWSEADVLGLPSTRRTRYAALIRDGRTARTLLGREVPVG